ncbi:U11/U12 small nuclear ribonucleoprotein 48 kDa protein-like [Vanessa cardui]|uniref:U11/U12 small nuclear ribonucleoprotein 48 kDa protein-like n=1 Tax=Vanessa cardui TaxID=171605 RepID=UPI001F139B7A|nr:U11/U12 small nuclear ribonucleoprotein 48 kDa protein-like [Vanessa cardui]
MESRQEYLSQLRDFIKEVDEEVSMILQNLQWDKDKLMEADPLVTCKFDTNHRIPLRKQKEHEEKCFLKCEGYHTSVFLPEPLEPCAKTLVKLTSDEIKQIIDSASEKDPLFKRGNGSIVSQPLTLDRITTTFTTDERRAIHDAVVNTMPSFHDLSDLALPSCGPSESKQKSRLEVLAELRDMRRRRARYRVAPRARNHSHALRDLIAAQMEMYTGSNAEVKIEQTAEKTSSKSRNDTNRHEDKHARNVDKYKPGNVRENFKDREHYVRDSAVKFSNKDGRHSEVRSDRERSSYSKERDRRSTRYDDKKRWEKNNDSHSEDRNSKNRDRERRSDNHRERHRDRKDEYRREEKTEHRRYYDYGHERSGKLGKHTSKDKSRHKENR